MDLVLKARPRAGLLQLCYSLILQVFELGAAIHGSKVGHSLNRGESGSQGQKRMVVKSWTKLKNMLLVPKLYASYLLAVCFHICRNLQSSFIECKPIEHASAETAGKPTL